MATHADRRQGADRSLGPIGRAPGREPSGAYRFSRSCLLVFLAATVDVFNVLDRGSWGRYLILLIPLVSIAVVRLRRPSSLVRRMSVADRVLLVLWLFGLGGSLVAALVFDSPATTRPLFIPMGIGFLHLLVLDSMREEEASRLLRMAALIGGLYILLAAIVNTGLIPGVGAFKQFRNAQFASVMIGLAGAIILRRPVLLAALVALALANFAAYPSATSVLGIIALIATLYMTRPRSSRARPLLIVALVGAAIAVSVVNLTGTLTVAGAYFDAVGKSDSTYARLSLWLAGIEQFKESPIVGSVFTEGPTVSAIRLRGGSLFRLPYHNDFVLFLAEGGLVGIGLLLGWMLAVEIDVLRRYRGFMDAGEHAKAGLLRLLLVGFNGFFVSSAFNPVLNGMSRSATIFAFYALAMAVGWPPHGPTARPPGPRSFAHRSVDRDVTG